MANLIPFRWIFSHLSVILLVAPLSSRLSAQTTPNVEPIEFRRGVPFVQVTVNGKGPFTFGIDTGIGGEAVVCPSLAEKLGLPTSGETEVDDPSGQNGHKIPLYLISSLKFAGVEFRGVKAAQHQPFPGEEDCDGSLGFLLFSNYLLSLDYPGQQLVLTTGSLSPDPGSGTIPFAMPHDAPEISIKVGGRQIDAQIDSRGMGLSLPKAFAKGLDFDSQPVAISRGRTIANDFEIQGARLAGDIQFAGYTFSRPFVEINPVFPLASFGSVPLRHFAVTFDQKNKLVRFASNQQTLTIDPPRMMAMPSPPSPQPAPQPKQ